MGEVSAWKALCSGPCPQCWSPSALVSLSSSSLPALPAPTHAHDYLVNGQLLKLLGTRSDPGPLGTPGPAREQAKWMYRPECTTESTASSGRSHGSHRLRCPVGKGSREKPGGWTWRDRGRAHGAGGLYNHRA